MRHSDLADYLDHDPFLEYPLHGSGDPSPPAVPPAGGRGDASPPSQAGTAGQVLEPSEPQPKASAKSGVAPEPKLSIPVAPDQPKRSAETERDKHKSDVLRMVMEVFPGARWTTREEYQRLAHHRERRGRKKRA